MWSEKEKKNHDPNHVTKESYLEVKTSHPSGSEWIRS